MKKLKLLLVLGAVFVVHAAHAASIVGSITFSGTANLDNTDLNAATKVNSWTSTIVGTASGNFADEGVAAGDAVTFGADWTFGGSKAQLWQVGGFTFNLTSSTIVSQSADALVVTGNGTATHASYDDSTGTFNFTIPGSGVGTAFSFAASSSVPDSGATATLLGLGLVGLAGAARRFKK